MSSYLSPFNNILEPNESNIKQFMDNLYIRSETVSKSRWNQANIDTLFYAGNQNFLNQNFGYGQTQGNSQYYFNIVQTPVNILSGYQRQHRKSINYVPTEGADPNTTDQYTRVITHVSNTNGIHEQFSKACELAAISGMVLLQPYLDYTGDDPAQGELKVKIWEYNSFVCDVYFRSPDMSDANYVWTQEFISKQAALDRFPEMRDQINGMTGTPQRYSRFYFLPENYNMIRNDLLVLSYIWYKWKRKKKRLYSKSRNQFFDFAGGQENLEQILYGIPDLEVVEVEKTTWKLATVLNEVLVYQGENPLEFDECPFVPVFWNYEPHNNQPDLTVRSLVRTMRSTQYLFNHKIINNLDIAEATINAGWKRKVGAVANEDNLKKSGNGYDVIINEGYEMTDAEKIIPSAVPQSDLELGQMLKDLMYEEAGINLENWSAQEDKQASTLTVLIKQAANLMVFQKYFDQWDYSLKLLGNLMLQIVLNNWNAAKVGLLIGEEPTPHFYSKIFAKYQVIVEEGLLTPTQKNYQAQQMLDINQTFGREVFPPSMIIKDMNIQGKAEMMEFLQQQEEQASEKQNDLEMVQHAIEDAKLKELYSKAAANIARAREDHSRSESNLGLYEERLSMIERNRSMSLESKQKALTSLLENVERFGNIETDYQKNRLEIENYGQRQEEEREKQDVQRRTEANKFLEQLLGEIPQHPASQNQGQEEMGQNAMQDMSQML